MPLSPREYPEAILGQSLRTGGERTVVRAFFQGFLGSSIYLIFSSFVLKRLEMAKFQGSFLFIFRCLMVEK